MVDDHFDFQQFYHHIVAFFEDCNTEAGKVEIDELLLWWNRFVPAHIFIEKV